MNNPSRIEFCSNGRTMDGWLCTDINDCDITKPLPFGDASAQHCYLSHGVEHVSSADAMKFLCEVFRILIPGGTFRIVVPALGLHMTRDHIKDLCIGNGHQIFFSFESLRAMLFAAGFEVADIRQTDAKEIDVHHETIGEEKDYEESLRVEATKRPLL